MISEEAEKRDILLLHELFGDQRKERLHVIVVGLFFECLPETDPEYILQRGGRGRKTDMWDGDCNFCVRRQTEIQKMSTEDAEQETYRASCALLEVGKRKDIPGFAVFCTLAERETFGALLDLLETGRGRGIRRFLYI
jgi:hypothetical protein